MRAQLYRLAALLFGKTSSDPGELRALMARVIYRSRVDALWVPPLLEIAEDHTPGEWLSAETARVFSVPPLMPYSSRWLGAEVSAAPTRRAIASLMQRYGMDGAGQDGGRSDHIVNELQLMSHLAGDGDPAMRSSERHFLEHQLAVWVPRYTAALRAAHPSRRLTMASIYLDRIIAWDRARLQAPRRPVPGKAAEVAHA